jgi:prepilin-type N-terminal cleavage/methylation domain-containing protein
MRSANKGFTLVELIVVIAIIAILASVSIVGYNQFIDNARDSRAETELSVITRQVESTYYVEGDDFNVANDDEDLVVAGSVTFDPTEVEFTVTGNEQEGVDEVAATLPAYDGETNGYTLFALDTGLVYTVETDEWDGGAAPETTTLSDEAQELLVAAAINAALDEDLLVIYEDLDDPANATDPTLFINVDGGELSITYYTGDGGSAVWTEVSLV